MIYKTRLFNRWANKSNIVDVSLKQAIDEATCGQCDAALGHNLYKKRVAIGNKGKRGGARTIIVIKKFEKAFFIYGYEKNILLMAA